MENSLQSRMLLIDDDSVFLQTMARSLTRRGEQILTAESAEEALRLVQQYRPEKILLDLNLGGDSGLQLLPQLLQALPGCYVVMLTGYASVATAVEAIKKGAVNYLCKPVTAQEVLAAFASEVGANIAEQGVPPETPDAPPQSEDFLPLSVPRLEWEHIQKVLNEHQGNISATARALGMHRRTLQRKLQKHAPR